MQDVLGSAVRVALGNSLVWEDLRGDFGAATQLVREPLAAAVVLATCGRAGAAVARLEPLVAADDPEIRGIALRVRRFALVMRLLAIPGGDGGLDAVLRSALGASGFEAPYPPGRLQLSSTGRRDLAALRMV